VNNETLGYLNIAVDSSLNKIGMNSPISSFEHLSDDSSIEISLEGVFDTIKKIWNKIKAFIIRIKDAVVNFFKKIFQSNKSEVERSKKILEKVKNSSNESLSFESNDEVLIPADLIKKLTIDGRLSQSNIRKAQDVLHDTVLKAEKMDVGIYSSIRDVEKIAMSLKMSDKDTLLKQTERLSENISNAIHRVYSHKVSLDEYRSDVLTNGQYLLASSKELPKSKMVSINVDLLRDELSIKDQTVRKSDYNRQYLEILLDMVIDMGDDIVSMSLNCRKNEELLKRSFENISRRVETDLHNIDDADETDRHFIFFGVLKSVSLLAGKTSVKLVPLINGYHKAINHFCQLVL